jgi:gluconate 5-dehydrogenase
MAKVVPRETAARHPFALDGKLALVAGGSRGLGFAIAEALAAAGATVLVNGRDEARLQAAVAALAREGYDAARSCFDIADEAAVAAGLAEIARTHGRLDILVDAVGERRRAPIADLTVADFRRMMEVDLTAGFALVKAALPLMPRDGGGRIILVTSIAGPIARAGDAAYTAAKGGLAALARSLAVELGPVGITANAIAPGYFATETNAAMVDDPDTAAFLARRCPLKRWGRPSEIGGAAVFLASDAAAYVNGHVLTVDGGMSASF